MKNKFSLYMIFSCSSTNFSPCEENGIVKFFTDYVTASDYAHKQLGLAYDTYDIKEVEFSIKNPYGA